MRRNQTVHFPTNHEIRGNEFRVIGAEGENLGVLSKEESLFKAQEAGLDLVLIAPQAQPPVVKIVDYSKFRYEQQKAEAKKRRGNTSTVKELRFKPNIDDHDLQIRINRATEFLEDGNKIRFSMPFYGRMIANKDIGREKFVRIIEALSEVADIEKQPSMEGNLLIMVIKPKTK